MKTLILFASPRKSGHTMQMLNQLTANLPGDIELIDCYDQKNISPCTDCRYCQTTFACAIQDDMQTIYRKLDTADNIVLASPIYFYSVTAPLKTIIDRCQIYWAANLRKDSIKSARKKGAILLVGGAPAFKEQFVGGELVLNGFLKEINAQLVGKVTMPNSDKIALSDCPEIMQQITKLAEILRA